MGPFTRGNEGEKEATGPSRKGQEQEIWFRSTRVDRATSGFRARQQADVSARPPKRVCTISLRGSNAGKLEESLR